jgi:hypothetical protein
MPFNSSQSDADVEGNRKPLLARWAQPRRRLSLGVGHGSDNIDLMLGVKSQRFGE